MSAKDNAVDAHNILNTKGLDRVPQLAMVGTIVFCTVGFGAEILNIIDTHRSPSMVWTLLAICNFSLWTLHGWNKDKHVMYANAIGLAMSLFVLATSVIFGG